MTIFVPDVERTAAFYQELFGLRVLSRQPTGVNLALGGGPAFLGVFSGGDREAAIHHFCLGVDDFDADGIMATLENHGVDARLRLRDGTTPEIYFTDPDGLQVQIQDSSYCGGTGALGNDCR